MFIKDNNWAGLRKISEALDKVKTKQYSNLRIPVGAFITFESEEGFQRCLALKNKSKVQILGQKFQVKEATEPTNIIWENRQHTNVSRFFKALFVVFVIIILLAISFSIILVLKQKSRESNSKYT